jgi:membrane protease YdiL (CAAX protease family)
MGNARPGQAVAIRGANRASVPWRDVAVFLILSAAISWPLWVGLTPLIAPLFVRTVLAQLGPMLAAIAVIRLRRQWARQASWLVARALPRAFFRSALAVVVVVVASGLGVLLSLLSGNMRLESWSGLGQLGGGFVFTGIMLVVWVGAWCEEYGWRGFLQPSLERLGGVRVAVLTSVVFCLWHSPAILLQGFDFPTHHVIGIGEFLVFSLPFTIVLTWLRGTSNRRGIAAPAAAHGAFNVISVVIMLTTTHSTNVIAAPVGLLGAAPFALVAIWILATGRLWPAASQAERKRRQEVSVRLNESERKQALETVAA